LNPFSKVISSIPIRLNCVLLQPFFVHLGYVFRDLLSWYISPHSLHCHILVASHNHTLKPLLIYNGAKRSYFLGIITITPCGKNLENSYFFTCLIELPKSQSKSLSTSIAIDLFIGCFACISSLNTIISGVIFPSFSGLSKLRGYVDSLEYLRFEVPITSTNLPFTFPLISGLISSSTSSSWIVNRDAPKSIPSNLEKRVCPLPLRA